MIERAQVERFRDVVAQRLGLAIDEGRRDLLAEILRQRAGDRVDAYLGALVAPGAADQELRALAEQLTVTETFFLRNPDHFRALVELVVPARLRARGGERVLRILSAGCASGEEPYSIAMVLAAQVDLAGWDLTILGVDVNPAMLEKARQARYSVWSLRQLPDELRSRNFSRTGNDFLLDASLRRCVQIEARNLVDDDAAFWRAHAFDVIFCRNVLMYFTPETAQAVVARLTHALVPDGYLFLGHAETLRGLSQGFHLCNTHDTFYYQRRSDAGVESALREPAAQRRALALQPSLPPLPADTTWIDVIRGAADRIAALAQERQRPAASPGGRSSTASAWDLAHAMELLRQERFGEGLEALRRLPPESLGSPDVELLRAVLLTNSGALAEAEAALARLLTSDDLNAGAHYLAALCREQADDVSGAVQHDRTAAYLDPSFAMPHLHMGLLARRQGDLDTAARELGHALALLAREDAARLLLFGGGFSREALAELCRAELRAGGMRR